MGIRRYKPTSRLAAAARRVSDFAELTPGAKPEKSLLVPQEEEGRPQQSGPDHRAASWRRSQAAVSRDRLPAQQGRRAGQGRIRFSTIRTAVPASPCCIMSTARSVTSWPPTGLKAGDEVDERSRRAADGWQLPAAEEHSARHDDSQHRAAAGPRRRAVPLGRHRAPRSLAREADWAQITLPSGEIRRVPAACRATIGAVGNSDHMNVVIGKAGRNRWKGIRPHVRGTAMNPIDHPHGGGEGRTKGGRHPVSPTASAPRVAARASVASRRTRRSFVVASRAVMVS